MALHRDIEDMHSEVPLAVTRVLVIDDETLFAKAVVRHLEKAGYRLEGIMRRSAIKDGQVLDQWLYAILRDEVG